MLEDELRVVKHKSAENQSNCLILSAENNRLEKLLEEASQQNDKLIRRVTQLEIEKTSIDNKTLFGPTSPQRETRPETSQMISRLENEKNSLESQVKQIRQIYEVTREELHKAYELLDTRKKQGDNTTKLVHLFEITCQTKF